MSLLYRGVEQLVARQAHNLEVARSSPAAATNVGEEVDKQQLIRFFFFFRDEIERNTFHFTFL